MKNVDKFEKAQKLVSEIAKIRKKLGNLGYNKSLKILPDFVECYAQDRFNLTLKNAEGYDGIDENDRKYQIKYTILKETTEKGKEKFTHSLDNIKRNKFDFLIAVILDKKDYRIKKVFKIPHDEVCQEDRLSKGSFRIEKVIKELDQYEVTVK
jgi:hypothetical protein